MFRLVRVRGDSMRPDYRDADYVVIAQPLWRRLRAGDDVVARHPALGTIIKRIAAISGDRLQLRGLDPGSTSGEDIGGVARADVLGRVVLRIPAP